MKKSLSTVAVCFIGAFLLGVCSCARSADSLCVVTWNTQTFFDAVNDGTEFSEFLSSKKHNITRYRARLDNVCSILGSVKADIAILTEIENADVAADIMQNMQNPLFYRYSAFSKESTAAFGCAVLSRYPIESVTAHQVALFANGKRAHGDLRPILQVIVRVGAQKIGVFACHWKSKKGESNTKSAALNEELRRAQGLVLATQISELLQNSANDIQAAIVAGDFNRSLYAFEPYAANVDAQVAKQTTDASSTRHAVLFHGARPDVVALTPLPNIIGSAPQNEYGGGNVTGKGNGGKGNRDATKVACDKDGTARTVNGTYFYNGEWEYIDHIFLVLGKNQNARFESAAVICSGNLLNADQTPNRYEAFSGRGVSDHLPLKAVINFKDSP